MKKFMQPRPNRRIGCRTLQARGHWEDDKQKNCVGWRIPMPGLLRDVYVLVNAVLLRVRECRYGLCDTTLAR